MRTLKIVLVSLVATLLLASPAFAQTGFFEFNDIQGVTFGGNCVVNDFVEICDVNTGMGGL